MISWLHLVLRTLIGMTRSCVSVSAENAILRQQLAVLQRRRSGRFNGHMMTWKGNGAPASTTWRTFEGIPQYSPGLPRVSRPATGDGPINFVTPPVLGGLHHGYRLAA